MFLIVKVLSSKVIGNLVAKSVRKFVYVGKLFSVLMFAQNVRSSFYRVVKRYEFELVIKLIVDNMRSVSVCRKVFKSVLANPASDVCVFQA